MSHLGLMVREGKKSQRRSKVTIAEKAISWRRWSIAPKMCQLQLAKNYLIWRPLSTMVNIATSPKMNILKTPSSL